jgi:uncharacterized coiled-coil protein SlyX
MTGDDIERARTEARIDELEARLAQQDQSLLDLGREIYRQQREIAQLAAQLRVLGERVNTLTPPETAPHPADEIPPHY